MVDGLIAGFFGDDGLVEGSVNNGFSKRFNAQMAVVQKNIEDNYKSISTAAVASIETKLGRVGQILSAEKPLRVVVDNSKLQIQLAVNVSLDTQEVAQSMASAPGGSYFTVNTARDGTGIDNFTPLEGPF